MFTNPQFDQSEETAMPQPAATVSPAVSQAMQIEGVEGAGTGQAADGTEVLILYLRDAAAASHVPPVLNGLRTQTQITGPIQAQPAR